MAEAGVAGATHRAIARRAGVPLGATTYYFPTLADLVAAGLGVVADGIRSDLAAWGAQLTRANVARVLPRLVREYATDRSRALLEYDLYVAAAREPALRPLARAWLDGAYDVLRAVTDAQRARSLLALVDGVLIQALVLDRDVDTRTLAAAVRALTG